MLLFVLELQWMDAVGGPLQIVVFPLCGKTSFFKPNLESGRLSDFEQAFAPP